MSATKILWGQVLTVFAIVLLTMWTATEWTAWRLGFQPQLGHPWFELLHFPVYLPPAFLWWWFAYDAYAPSIFIEGAYIAASGGIIAAAVAIGMSVWRAREAKNAETYGSARWAQTKEIEQAGLLGPDGVVLGRQAMSIFDLVDIDQIEILRGPQGTLFGKNSSAGVLNIITKKPTSDPEFMFGASYGSLNEVKLKASANGAVADDLDARVSGYFIRRDGTGTNFFNGGEVNNDRQWALRGRATPRRPRSASPSPLSECANLREA